MPDLPENEENVLATDPGFESYYDYTVDWEIGPDVDDGYLGQSYMYMSGPEDDRNAAALRVYGNYVGEECAALALSIPTVEVDVGTVVTAAARYSGGGTYLGASLGYGYNQAQIGIQFLDSGGDVVSEVWSEPAAFDGNLWGGEVVPLTVLQATAQVAGTARMALRVDPTADYVSAMMNQQVQGDFDDVWLSVPPPPPPEWETRGTMAFTMTEHVPATSGQLGNDGGELVQLTSAPRADVGDTMRLLRVELTPIEPHQWVRFGVRAWLSSSLDAHVGVEFLDASGDPLGVAQVWNNPAHCYSDTGGDLSVVAEAPPGAALVRPRFEAIATAKVRTAQLAYVGSVFVEVTDIDPRPVTLPATPVVRGDPRKGRLPWDRDPWVLDYPGTHLEFGTLGTGIVMHAAPDFGARSFTTEDEPVPRGDGRTFGQDYLEGSTITFTLAVNGEDESECRKKLDVISHAWRGDSIRLTPGAVASLTSDGGRTCYGRPRRFAVDREELPLGVAIVTADFETSDDGWYDTDESNSASITFYPDLGGGLVAPLRAPLATTRSSDRSRVFEIEGNHDTWPIFDIVGPITNPVLEIVDTLKIELNTSLAENQSVTIDTRPFQRSILRNDRVSLAGTMTRKSTRLSQAALAPGRYEMVLRGDSRGRIATATIRWHEAYSTA